MSKPSAEQDWGSYPSYSHLFSDLGHGSNSDPAYIGNEIIDTSSPSDAKFKRNITDTSFSINDLMKIEIKDYQYKPEYTQYPNIFHTGIIANDLQSIYPNAVGTGKRLVKEAVVEYDSEGNAEVIEPEVAEEYLYVKYNELVPLLIKSVQDIKLENERLAQEIQILKEAMKQ